MGFQNMLLNLTLRDYKYEGQGHENFKYWYLKNYLTDPDQIWWTTYLSPRDDSIKFWRSMVKGQGHSSTLNFPSSVF